MKRVLVLGATGSIGRNALDVIRSLPEEFKCAGLAVLHNRAAAEELGREFGAPVFCGEGSAERAVKETDADIVLVATVGLSGLAPTLAAIEKGCDIALATKEVMVMAGELVTNLARAKGVKFLPVDSEHSAIFQCLQGAQHDEIEKLILTASGGPFLDEPADLSTVTPAQALNHPRWKMGPKVTVDSATMMNKGFEILEAHWLFDVPVERIEAVVHPESIVHSLVTFRDGATLAQLSPPDMRVAIQYALSWPRRFSAPTRERLNLAAAGALTFRAPNPERFPCLRLVRAACARGGCSTAVLAAADEIAVQRFLAGEFKYTDIPQALERALEEVEPRECNSLEAILSADESAREFVRNMKV